MSPANGQLSTRSPMHVYALVNQKGGCGKTTTAVNLAGALSEHGQRVLLIDLDPQAHATMALGVAPDDQPSVADVLIDGVAPRAAFVGAQGGIVLLPATERLAEFEEHSERTIHPERVLAEALVGLRGRFDRVILDCPPRADGVLCANALAAATTALLVVETGAFALQGALKALNVLAEVADNQAADDEGEGPAQGFDVRVVGTLFDRRTRFARDLLIALQARFGPAMYDTVIRTSVRLREAAAMGAPVQTFAPMSRAAGDFAALAREIVADKRELLHSPADLGGTYQVPRARPAQHPTGAEGAPARPAPSTPDQS